MAFRWSSSETHRSRFHKQLVLQSEAFFKENISLKKYLCELIVANIRADHLPKRLENLLHRDLAVSVPVEHFKHQLGFVVRRVQVVLFRLRACWLKMSQNKAESLKRTVLWPIRRQK